MIDSFVLLTPLLVLPIVLLFVFVGCAVGEVPPTPTPPSLTMKLSNIALAPVFQMSFNATQIVFTDPMTMRPAPPHTYEVVLTPMREPRITIMGGEELETRHRETSRLGANPPVFEWTITNPRPGSTWTVTCHAHSDAEEYTFFGSPIVRSIVRGTDIEVFFQLTMESTGRFVIQPL